ncbi:MAG TPA: DNA repair protein RecN [Egibacteraceae bacterium]|nr:DNA repair protein RecN [Egibacteraceae bacterium]
MLEELYIRDVGVIDEVTLRLQPGLNVLTGETGAGKTMVVSALELLIGGRADADRVRAGASVAVVEGRLRPAPSGASQWLGEGDEDLVVSREVAREGSGGGRSRGRLGGRLAPASALVEIVGAAVEVHAQSDTTRLSLPAVQRELLDRSGGDPVALARKRFTESYDAWRAAATELDDLRGDERDRAREVDRLAFELGEIDQVAPQPGEEETIAAELERLEHAEALTEAAAGAASALADDGGGRDALGSAVAALRRVASHDEALGALLGRAEGLAAEVQDLAVELAGYAERLELDPQRLEELRDRRGRLSALCRKYGPDAAAVAAYADEGRARLRTLQGGEARAKELQQHVEGLRDAMEGAAAELTAARQSAGQRLAAAVEGHLADLAMAGARMDVSLEPISPGPTGADQVSFQLAANPGEAMLPLAKAASGGERSRVALAVRLALTEADETAVVVFDEVDAGIGGQTALAVGEKLARLARSRQVLCVTHLPQLAAFADAHFAVSKSSASGRTVAAVRALDEPQRITELSRMLSGASDSQVAADHAAELLAGARQALAAG